MRNALRTLFAVIGLTTLAVGLAIAGCGATSSTAQHGTTGVTVTPCQGETAEYDVECNGDKIGSGSTSVAIDVNRSSVDCDGETDSLTVKVTNDKGKTNINV